MRTISSRICRLRHCAYLYYCTTKPELPKKMQRPIQAQKLREAAYTIWQLRDDLQQANAENELLRQELAIREASEQENVIEHLRQECIDWEDMYRALVAENAKLREQVERLHADQAHWELGNCPGCPNVVSLQEALEQNAKLRELLQYVADNHLCGTWLLDRMRESGIEVTE